MGHGVVSDEVRREGRLVREGSFALVRHPLYLAAILFYVSLVISTLSLASAALLVGILAFYDIIATYEEGFLTRKHGDAYRVYQRKVPKWIPRIRAAEFDRAEEARRPPPGGSKSSPEPGVTRWPLG